MLQLTRGIVDQLAPAYVCMDYDVMYLFSPENDWIIVWVGASNYLVDPQLKALLVADENNAAIDIRALVADDAGFDFAAERFIPPHSHKGVPLYHRPWSKHVYNRNAPAIRDVVDLRNRIDSQMANLNAAGIDLSDLFESGQARAIYPAKLDSKRVVESGRAAERYRFEFDTETGPKLFVVDGGLWRGFHELGMRMHLPLDIDMSQQDNHVPKAVAELQVEEGQVFGFFNGIPDTGTNRSSDGRDLFFDAARLCWYTEGEALKMLSSPDAHDPSLIDLQDDFDNLLNPRKWSLFARQSDSLRMGVGVLRWLGWADADIQAHYFDDRPTILWKHIVPRIKTEAQEALDELRNTRRGQEGTARYKARQEARRMCSLMDQMRHALEDETFTIPALEQLVIESVEEE